MVYTKEILEEWLQDIHELTKDHPSWGQVFESITYCNSRKNW